jgi:predicted nucleotidyltransferase
MTFLDANHISEVQLASFCRQWKVRELALFGSAARGETQAHSDVDLLVTFAPEATWDLFDFVDLRDDLGHIFHRPVDLVEAPSIRNPYRRAMIDREKRVLYAA